MIETEFRWFIEKSRVSDAAVRSVSVRMCVDESLARQVLEKTSGPHLQWRMLGGEWQDVPTVVEYRE